MVRLDRRTKIKLAVFTTIAVAAGAVMTFRYIDVPAMLFGVGHYTVTVELPRAGGLYRTANVTYRGTTVGRVDSVELTDAGVRATLSMNSGIEIPSGLRAEIHSVSAIGEQYVDLAPDGGPSLPLKNGDVIPASRTSVPPDVDSVLDAASRGLAAIPGDNLQTVIDESYVAVGGLGPDLSRLVKGSTQLSIDAYHHLDALTTLIDQSPTVLDSQGETSGAIRAWAAHLATVTSDLRSADPSFARLLRNGPAALGEGRQLFERLRPSLPILLANLVSIADVAITYQPALEQLLVLVPQGVSLLQGMIVANTNTKQDYKGLYLDFNLNFNLPPVCNTGFLPAAQQRGMTFQDHPERPPGDLYCRVPQDSSFNVRGARNYPCLSVPGKRAPTVKMCESDEQYVPLNDGFNWKGDPNATLSGQDVPQPPPGASQASSAPLPPPPPIPAAMYDPATGSYIGPDGRLYTQSNLSRTAPEEKTWQSMLIPPTSN